MGTGSVWVATDTISIARANQKTILIDTGGAIAAVTAGAGGQPDQLAIATTTASNFTADRFYCRKSTNDGWYSLQVSGTDVTLNGTKVSGTT